MLTALCLSPTLNVALPSGILASSVLVSLGLLPLYVTSTLLFQALAVGASSSADGPGASPSRSASCFTLSSPTSLSKRRVEVVAGALASRRRASWRLLWRAVFLCHRFPSLSPILAYRQ